jgi:hypothetical protein
MLTLMFRKGRCCGGQGRRPMAASINTSLFAPSKKITPRPPLQSNQPFIVLTETKFMHLLGSARLPSPQTSWAYPAWPRTPDSDKPRVPCVAACAARRWRATRCASPSRAARRPSTQATRHSAALRTRWRRRRTIRWRSCTWQTRARFASCCSATGRSGSSRSWVPPFPDDGECVLVTTHFRAGYMVSLIS